MHALHTTRPTLFRILSVFALVVFFSAAANAYTVVMRGGRRVEIPSHFVLTDSTLTYEVSHGVQITIAVAAIDIPETEKANKEAAGSFLRHAQADLPESKPGAEQKISTSPATPARRTITNRDLEASMRRRRDSEVAYESRRKQLGLPSVEESRQQAAAEALSIARELEQTRATEKESESYWRARASALRTEIAAVDAELGYVRRQLDEPLFSTANGSFATVVDFVPFISFGRFGRGTFPSPRSRRPGIFVAPRGAPQLSGRVGFGNGARRGQVFLNPLPFPRSRSIGPPLLVPPNLGVFGSTYDFSYERNELITRFNALAATRAGLSARWRELEDEARRAGAPPGWLRP